MEDSQEPEHDAPRIGVTASIGWLIGVSLVATGFARLPLWSSGIDPPEYWLRTGELLATLPLMVYLIALRRPPARVVVAAIALAMLATLVAFLLPRESDLSILARLHLFIALWALVAVPFSGRAFRTTTPRVAFVAFAGEVVLLTVLLLCGGIAMTALTYTIFLTVHVDIGEWYARNVVVWGLVTAPLVAAYLATGPRPLAIVGRVAIPFVPLLLVTLVAYLGAMAVAGWAPLETREFLANLNAVMVGVAFVSLAVICDRTRGAARRFADLLNVGLVALTLIVSGVALVAIAVRLYTAGFDPVRLVVLGTDSVVFLLFAGLMWHYARFAAGAAPLTAVTDWIARYLPILPAWAVAAATLPLVFFPAAA
jgi:hypothetical protein